MKPIVPKNWFLVLKDSAILIIDSDCSRIVMDNKHQGMDKPEDYEVISRDEVFRRLTV